MGDGWRTTNVKTALAATIAVLASAKSNLVWEEAVSLQMLRCLATNTTNKLSGA